MVRCDVVLLLVFAAFCNACEALEEDAMISLMYLSSLVNGRCYRCSMYASDEVEWVADVVHCVLDGGSWVVEVEGKRRVFKDVVGTLESEFKTGVCSN